MTALPRASGSSPAKRMASVGRVQEGFAQRYERLFPRVFAYVYGRVQDRAQAEDLVADVFERAFAKAASLRNEEAFSTWLFAIARNVVVSHGRRRSREAVVDPEVFSSITAGKSSVESEVLLREEAATIARSLRELPQREQEIVALRFDAGLSNGQIAQIMGLSEANVRVILFRTLRKLRQMMTVPEQG